MKRWPTIGSWAMKKLVLFIHYILLQHVSAASYGHHHVFLQTHEKEVCFLGGGIPFTENIIKNSEIIIIIIIVLK
jgi:hypothetical protein